ncbi:MAG: protein BatD [Paludibacteraceae bacterium]|nr:protein BatD [Paludibacteraceae bacterium]
MKKTGKTINPAHIIFSIVLALLAVEVVPLQADDVVFKADAPQTVVVGTPFRLTYIVNQQSSNLRAPEFTGFSNLSGPSVSTNQSVSWVNGKQTSTFEQRYTYVLEAQKEGTFSIGPATVEVGGGKYSSNGLKIKVLPADKSAKADNGGHANGNQGGANVSGVPVSEQVFVRTIMSKRHVYEQECVLLSYKLYTLYDISNYSIGKLPDFQGFVKEELDVSNNGQLSLESYNGRNYRTATLYQVILYPQKSGSISIDKATFDFDVRIPTRVPAGFGGYFETYQMVPRSVTASATTVEVDDLPTGRPAIYSGAVGTYQLASTISSTQSKANEAITLKLTISGTGNIKTIKTPELSLPATFEQYEPKIENATKTTTSGIRGQKTIEYLFVPRSEGHYTIPSIQLAYFDTESKSYKTLTSPEYELDIQKGDGATSTIASGANPVVGKADVQVNQDINYINTRPLRLTNKQDSIYGTRMHWLLYLVPLLVSVLLFFLLRRNIRLHSDVIATKTRKANKTAQKRLKRARMLLKEGKQSDFYDEIMRALWAYVSDKLAIPTSALSKDNVAQELLGHGAHVEQIEEMNEILSECEFARYAPSTQEQTMGDIYQRTAILIGRFEDQIR